MEEEQFSPEVQAQLLNFRLDLINENLTGIRGSLETIADATVVSLDEKQFDRLLNLTETRRTQEAVTRLIESINMEGK